MSASVVVPMPEAPIAVREARPPLHLVDPEPDPVLELTPREREVMGLIAQGLSNRAVCRSLVISPKTLERHVQNIFMKLDLPPSDEDHRRVRAVLTYLRSPLAV
jgi:DNA-binding NarL/FixJ family response regulator